MSRNFILLIIGLGVVVAIAITNIIGWGTTTTFNNHWEQAIPNQKIPEGLTSLSSKECGLCHKDHYEEWNTSTHSMAWKDLQFQAEIAKESSPYMCINCHIPLANQQEYLITGLEDGDIYKPIKEKNPLFDPELQQEGINCASCHVRNGAILSVTVSNRAPHKSVQDDNHLTEQLCINCHNAVAVVTPELVCTFETGDEWKAGPFAETKNCKTCHMPSIDRSIVEGFPKRKSRMHYFMGSGIPKLDSLKPERLDGLHYEFTGIKMSYRAMDSVVIKTNVINKFAGHNVPTGDPERFIITKLSVFNTANGALVAVDSFRIGEHWEWYPVAKKIADNNLTPGESRSYSITALLPVGHYNFELKAYKYRTTQELIKYNKLGDSYPSHIQFYKKTIPFKVE